MLSTVKPENVYLACGGTDMRKSINGLSIMVLEYFKEDPFAGTLFVFCNRQRNKIKILRWEADGFWLYTKDLKKADLNGRMHQKLMDYMLQKESCAGF